MRGASALRASTPPRRASRPSATSSPTGSSARLCGKRSALCAGRSACACRRSVDTVSDRARRGHADACRNAAGERERLQCGRAGRRRRRRALGGARGGGHRRCRRADYGQVALVTNVRADRGARLALPTSASPSAVRWPLLPLRTAATPSSGPRPPEAARMSPGRHRRGFPEALQRALRLARRPLRAAGRSASYPLQLTRADAAVAPAHGAHRQRRAGAASGRGTGLQPRPARCCRAGGADCRGRADPGGAAAAGRGLPLVARATAAA